MGMEGVYSICIVSLLLKRMNWRTNLVRKNFGSRGFTARGSASPTGPRNHVPQKKTPPAKKKKNQRLLRSAVRGVVRPARSPHRRPRSPRSPRCPSSTPLRHPRCLRHPRRLRRHRWPRSPQSPRCPSSTPSCRPHCPRRAPGQLALQTGATNCGMISLV
jgi:hypothetical protein